MPLTIDSTVRLRNGVEMPWFGFGTYKITDPGQIVSSVTTALEFGYRAIDTASMYGNEHEIGQAIEASGIPRDDLFITSKVWNSEQGYESTLAAAHHSLERLGTDYLDLYLIHWPIPRRMEETWRAMEELLGSGRTRAIGVSNFLEHHLDQLWGFAEELPAVDQVEFHPRLQQPSLVEACREREIVMEAWSPLMRGDVLEIPELVRIGERYGKSAAQVTLRWILQRGIVTIPKSVHADRIRENAEIFDFELTAEEMAVINGLDTGTRRGRHPNTMAGE